MTLLTMFESIIYPGSKRKMTRPPMLSSSNVPPITSLAMVNTSRSPADKAL